MEACGQVQAPWRVPGFAFHNTWWPMHHCATGLQYLWGKSASVLKFYLFFLLEAENQGKTLWPQNLPGKPDVSMKRLVCWKETFEVSWSPTEVGVIASPPLKGNTLRIFITFWWGEKKKKLLLSWWNGDVFFHCPALTAVMSAPQPLLKSTIRTIKYSVLSKTCKTKKCCHQGHLQIFLLLTVISPALSWVKCLY